MMTLELIPELEEALVERAQSQGTTPQLLALDGLREKFLPAPSAPPPIEVGGQTLADFLGDFIGCIHSGEVVPGGAQMSQDIGNKFAEGMVRKRQEGRL